MFEPAESGNPDDAPADLVLTPLELIEKIAALVPRPRTHRHRYFGVLAPNAPLRAAVTALAPARRTRCGAFHPASADFSGEQRSTPPPRGSPLSVGDAAGAHP